MKSCRRVGYLRRTQSEQDKRIHIWHLMYTNQGFYYHASGAPSEPSLRVMQVISLSYPRAHIVCLHFDMARSARSITLKVEASAYPESR